MRSPKAKFEEKQMLFGINGLIGIMLLTSGRRLFWLFVGGVGFVAGLQMAQLYLSAQPAWVTWAIAFGFGLIGALMAVFFQALAIGLGGFIAGSIISAHLAVLIGFSAVPIVILAGGLFGLFLLYPLFDWALIGLSSLVGSTLIVQSLHWNPRVEMVLYVALLAAGVVFQTILLRKRRPKT
jgi:hypothetical protein